MQVLKRKWICFLTWIQSETVGIHQIHVLLYVTGTWFQNVSPSKHCHSCSRITPKSDLVVPKTWNQIDKTMIIPGEEAFQGTWGPDPAWGRKSADATAAVCGCILWTTRTMPREMRTLVDARVPSMIKTQPKPDQNATQQRFQSNWQYVKLTIDRDSQKISPQEKFKTYIQNSSGPVQNAANR